MISLNPLIKICVPFIIWIFLFYPVFISHIEAYFSNGLIINTTHRVVGLVLINLWKTLALVLIWCVEISEVNAAQDYIKLKVTYI